VFFVDSVDAVDFVDENRGKKFFCGFVAKNFTKQSVSPFVDFAINTPVFAGPALGARGGGSYIVHYPLSILHSPLSLVFENPSYIRLASRALFVRAQPTA
jgi:hypothetical protein